MFLVLRHGSVQSLGTSVGQIETMLSRACTPALNAGRALDRRHHLDEAVLALGDLDAEPVELATRVDLHLAIGLGVEERRVRIELGEHAAHRALDQRALVHLFDVVLLHEAQHAGEQAEVVVARRRRDVPRGARDHHRDRAGQSASEEGDQVGNALHGRWAPGPVSIVKTTEIFGRWRAALEARHSNDCASRCRILRASPPDPTPRRRAGSRSRAAAPRAIRSPRPPRSGRPRRPIPESDVDPVEMGGHGEVVRPVVEDHDVAIAAEAPGIAHPTRSYRVNRGPHRRFPDDALPERGAAGVGRHDAPEVTEQRAVHRVGQPPAQRGERRSRGHRRGRGVRAPPRHAATVSSSARPAISSSVSALRARARLLPSWLASARLRARSASSSSVRRTSVASAALATRFALGRAQTRLFERARLLAVARDQIAVVAQQAAQRLDAREEVAQPAAENSSWSVPSSPAR
jgi:hypothetical protein